MLTQKALNKKLTATLCTTTNTIFVHKNNKAYLQYSYNSANVIRNINNVQRIAFNNLPATYTQKQKTFNKIKKLKIKSSKPEYLKRKYDIHVY